MKKFLFFLLVAVFVLISTTANAQTEFINLDGKIVPADTLVKTKQAADNKVLTFERTSVIKEKPGHVLLVQFYEPDGGIMRHLFGFKEVWYDNEVLYTVQYNNVPVAYAYDPTRGRPIVYMVSCQGFSNLFPDTKSPCKSQ